MTFHRIDTIERDAGSGDWIAICTCSNTDGNGDGLVAFTGREPGEAKRAAESHADEANYVARPAQPSAYFAVVSDAHGYPVLQGAALGLHVDPPALISRAPGARAYTTYEAARVEYLTQKIAGNGDTDWEVTHFVTTITFKNGEWVYA